MNTIITYDDIERKWNIILVNNPQVYAVSNSNFEDLLMGKSSHNLSLIN